MLKDVVEVEALAPYKFRVRFEDGVGGTVALDEIVKFEGVFAPLRDPEEFRKIQVHPEFICPHHPLACPVEDASLAALPRYASSTSLTSPASTTRPRSSHRARSHNI